MHPSIVELNREYDRVAARFLALLKLIRGLPEPRRGDYFGKANAALDFNHSAVTQLQAIERLEKELMS